MTHSVSGSRPLLILASASPRRLSLLARVGMIADVRPVHIDEAPLPGEEPGACAVRLAESKARASWDPADPRPTLAADTVVSVEGKLLGKPADPDEARSMLRELSGRWHEVVTGIALMTAHDTVLTACATTRVAFAPLSSEEIDRYATSGEPDDKAGGYAIQGAASWFVREIDGSPTNVVGLPIEIVRSLFLEAGLPLPTLRPIAIPGVQDLHAGDDPV